MPERLRVKEMLVETVSGEAWNYYSDNVDTPLAPLAEAMDDLYLQIVDRVDWNRILLIAEGRCRHEGHGHVLKDSHVCGESVRDAMCCKDIGAYDFKGKHHYEQPRHVDWVKHVCTAGRKRKLGLLKTK